MRLPRYTLSLILFLAGTVPAISQTLPQKGVNAKDASGKRNGPWIVWLNRQSRPIAVRDSIVYYREITYSHGTPDGTAKEYFANGKVHWEGALLSDFPVDVFTGRVIFYDESGRKTREVQYNRVGSEVASTSFEKQFLEDDSLQLYLQNGMTAYRLGKYPDAMSSWQKGLDREEKQSGTASENYALFLSNLSLLYQTIGNYEKAELYSQRAVESEKKRKGGSEAISVASLNNLALVYMALGKYDKAEPIFQENLRHVKPGNSTYYYILNNLGLLYTKLGRYDEAEPMFTRIIGDWSARFTPDYPAFLTNLAELYRLTGKNSKRERLLLRAVEIASKAGNKSPNYPVTLQHLALYYSSAGQFKKSEPLIRTSMRLTREMLGENNARYAEALAEYGAVLAVTGHFDSAVFYVTSSVSIIRTITGLASPVVNNFLEIEAMLYMNKGQFSTAEPLYLEVGQHVMKQIQDFFPYLSEREKEEFYTTLRPMLERLRAFMLLRVAQNPSMSGALYDNQLATKGLLLNNSAKWKQRIRASGDKKLSALYFTWEDRQAYLAKLYQEKDPGKKELIDSIARDANRLEKELSLRSELFGQIADKKGATWIDVQKKLGPDEVAVEIVRLRTYGPKRSVTDSSDASLPQYIHSGLLDTIRYVALIIKAKSAMPEMVVLPNGNAMEKHALNYYRNCIRFQKSDERSYAVFWDPIAKAIGKKTKKVWFSADGVYHSINLNTLFNTKSHHYLIDDVDIRLLTTTRDLLVARTDEPFNNLAYLFGYPDYDLPPTVHSAEEKNSSTSYYPGPLTRGDFLVDLPATKTEVESIGGMLTSKGWDPKVLIAGDALEETLKDAFKPRVLHIATHGYFQPDSLQIVRDNPLLQSGLLLAGAGQSLSGHRDDRVEDGILTAYEAMNLNLDNTDMVVLSACETGLGEIRNGEGVYGLQRAFKVAGARSIVMSLWKVNDEATQELITQFYRNWLESGDKSGAFKKAAISVRARYPDPYFWGAFVMIEE